MCVHVCFVPFLFGEVRFEVCVLLSVRVSLFSLCAALSLFGCVFVSLLSVCVFACVCSFFVWGGPV